MALNERDGGATDANERDGGATDSDVRREIEELKFLVGTSCSRLTNLLIDRGAAHSALAAEASFMAEHAGRLADLLETPPPDAAAEAAAEGR